MAERVIIQKRSGGTGFLSPRKVQILKTIVGSYLESLEPVASRTVQKRLGSLWSAATIRNEMADLEEDGYLYQPHTSAGRIPTEKAIRYWIESALKPEPPPEEIQGELERLIREQKDPHSLLAAVSDLLSDVLKELVVMSLPRPETLKLKRCEFLPLGEGQFLLIWITTEGVVLHRVFYLEEELPEMGGEKGLKELERFVNERFQGLELKRIISLLNEEVFALERRLQALIRNALRELYTSSEEIILKGALRLAAEQNERGALTPIYEALLALENRHTLIQLLNKLCEGKGVQVLLNEETGLNAQGIGVVGSTYGHSAPGILGVVGPLYMPYPRVIGLLKFTAHALTRAWVTR